MNILPAVREKVERPFSVKLKETEDIISHHIEEFGTQAVVAFSGGKDSELVLYLVLRQEPLMPVIFSNTGVEYPETLRFIKELQAAWQFNLNVLKPEMSFWKCVDRFGFATTRSLRHKSVHCCYYIKEKPALQFIRENGILGDYTGITAVESYNRMFLAKNKGTCYHLKHEGFCKINPILWWTEAEVWEFIIGKGLPYNSLYDQGIKRVGCMPCTSYLTWESQLRRTNPKLYQYIKLRKDHQYTLV